MPDLEQQIRIALDEIKDPCSLAAGYGMGISEMGLVKSVSISDRGDVTIALRLTSPFCHMIGFFKKEAMRIVSDLPEVRSVEMTADQGLDWSPRNIDPAAETRRQEALATLSI
ncbi:iron-sulfur cluster assembly protein [Altererythrobacter sp. SALINAS58]|uniref:iron-sulfur cluster assembly protein n=1 Tax=Alteripontixanthobacter muriae TaxID=2705546 RepID=UPI001576BB8F|nr:iron-sulfur cluster assembly protein [Alteripontixanthobacter muriae]NTZ43807.1 iron-sulfur cluster assembly protein [Alteripontixanthobacter muriae]